MEKNDIKEIRKAIKGKDNCISWIYGVYVDADNQAVWEQVRKFASMEDAAKFRHQTMFSKVLSPGLGKNSFAGPLMAQQDILLELRHTEGKDTAEFEAFKNMLLTDFKHTDPYYATLTRIIYDVPARSGDGMKLEDGTAVYEALLFSVCPAALSKPVLGLCEDQVTELDRRWQIGNPMSGFLYPAFSDRGEDRNAVLIHSNKPEEESFINGLFMVDTESAPVGIQVQKDLFTSLIGQMDVTLEAAAEITESIAQKAAEEDAFMLDPVSVKKIAEAAGADTGTFDEIYEETIGDTPILMSAVADSYVTVKTDSAVIKVPADRSQLIETRVIDGREFILIPADGEVTVNGVSVTAVPGRTEEMPEKSE